MRRSCIGLPGVRAALAWLSGSMQIAASGTRAELCDKSRPLPGGPGGGGVGSLLISAPQFAPLPYAKVINHGMTQMNATPGSRFLGAVRS